MSELPSQLEKIKRDYIDKFNKPGPFIEEMGYNDGFIYMIVFTVLGFRTGYILIPASDYEKNIDKFSDDDFKYEVDVHGGISFNQKMTEDYYAVGFDAGHYCYDQMDFESFEKYYPHGAHKDRVNLFRSIFTNTDSTVKDVDFMREECRKLANGIRDYLNLRQ